MDECRCSCESAVAVSALTQTAGARPEGNVTPAAAQRGRASRVLPTRFLSTIRTPFRWPSCWGCGGCNNHDATHLCPPARRLGLLLKKYRQYPDSVRRGARGRVGPRSCCWRQGETWSLAL